MVKKEFVQKYAKMNNLEYKEAQKIVDNFIAFTIEILRQEDILIFRGFGTFHKRKRKAHKMSGPSLKQKISKEYLLEEKEHIFFKPSNCLLKTKPSDSSIFNKNI
ncbi:HU family DNA-binding protein [Fusobacterium sp.]|uniref:HU family DNA-binding protein n=1 Tax=Fusobacterium sp. TaxID=68766 RepID=UPI0025C30D7F|nr:HU family DNA-binding protein [Fusobacterium sp.]